MTFADGTSHPASSLSDGTLRFLALALLEQDPEFRGLLCLEEPENGIHPERIPAMIRLLTDLAMDTHLPVGPDNPLRQVIINTHSPACAAEAPEDSLLSAEPANAERNGIQLPTMRLSALASTWRTDNGARAIKKGRLIQYLSPVPRVSQRKGRVADREEAQIEMDFGKES
jgi:predicted ATPase